jgi:hypothetical protein
MIHCLQPVKPIDFDTAVQEARNKLEATLASNGGHIPNHYSWNSKWTEYRDDMAEEADFYCSYTGTQRRILDLNIDHYFPKADFPRRAYDWSNYRIAWHWINNHKRNRIVLDPYIVESGWFKITIPGFQLVIDHIPDARNRLLAQQTLGKETGLDLNNQYLVNERAALYQKFVLNRSLVDVSEEMPLLGEAIRQYIIRFVRKSNQNHHSVTVETLASQISTPVGGRNSRRSMKILDAERLVATLCNEGIITTRNNNLFII